MRFDIDHFLEFVPDQNVEIHLELFEAIEAEPGLRIQSGSDEGKSYHVFVDGIDQKIFQVIARKGQSNIPTDRTNHDLSPNWDFDPPECARRQKRIWRDIVKKVSNDNRSLVHGGLKRVGVEFVVKRLGEFRNFANEHLRIEGS